MREIAEYSMDELRALQAYALRDTLSFTRVAFKFQTNGTKYIVGKHHRLICEALDKVYCGDIKRLIVNIAPRYGKTELISKKFVEYGFAHNPRCKWIHLSYSDDLVLDNSREIKETMESEFFRTLFPDSVPVSGSAKMWKTKAGGGFYAVSAAGQVTGFGAGQVESDLSEQDLPEDYFSTGSSFAGAIIIDDPLKPEDALSDVQRERVNQRFDSTIRSRVNSRNTPIIVVMQRLHEKDLCGHLIQAEPDEWSVLTLPCIEYDEDGTEHPLWEFKHTLEELHKLASVNPYIFETQYMQNPKPLEGLMYQEFRTYETLPTGAYRIKNYTDSADTGADFLCSICYAEFQHAIYVLDVLYTNKPMEYTEPETARMLTRNAVQQATIESNNGGRGFARNVERNCRELGNLKTRVVTFTQTANKQVRIFSHSAEVNNIVFFPKGWEHKWREFYQAVTGYRKEGRNAHDDAPDALTGLIEHRDTYQTTRISRT